VTPSPSFWPVMTHIWTWPWHHLDTTSDQVWWKIGWKQLEKESGHLIRTDRPSDQQTSSLRYTPLNFICGVIKSLKNTSSVFPSPKKIKLGKHKINLFSRVYFLFGLGKNRTCVFPSFFFGAENASSVFLFLLERWRQLY